MNGIIVSAVAVAEAPAAAAPIHIQHKCIENKRFMVVI